jgi:hypothetical protein
MRDSRGVEKFCWGHFKLKIKVKQGDLHREFHFRLFPFVVKYKVISKVVT